MGMDNPGAALLGVRYKTKLPKGWSYPVGTEVLTDILGGVADLAPKPLSFRHSEPYFLRDRRQRKREDLPLPVIEVGVSIRDPGADVRVEGRQWEIFMRSVPSQFRQSVRACLSSEGLPRVRQWLMQGFSQAAMDNGPVCRLSLREEHMVMLWETRGSHFADFRKETLPCVLLVKPG